MEPDEESIEARRRRVMTPEDLARVEAWERGEPCDFGEWCELSRRYREHGGMKELCEAIPGRRDLAAVVQEELDARGGGG